MNFFDNPFVTDICRLLCRFVPCWLENTGENKHIFNLKGDEIGTFGQEMETFPKTFWLGDGQDVFNQNCTFIFLSLPS